MTHDTIPSPPEEDVDTGVHHEVPANVPGSDGDLPGVPQDLRSALEALHGLRSVVRESVERLELAEEALGEVTRFFDVVVRKYEALERRVRALEVRAGIVPPEVSNGP